MSPFASFRVWLRRAPLANRLSAAAAAILSLALLVWIALPPTSKPVAVGTSSGGFSPVSGGSAGTGAGGSTAAVPGSVAAGSTSGGSASTGALSSGSQSGVATGSGASAASPTGGTSSGAVPAGGSGTAQAAGSGSAPAAGSPSGAGGTATGSGASTASSGTCRSLTPLKVGAVIPDVGSGSASLNSTFGIPSPAEQQADYQAIFDSINKAGGVACHSLVGDYQVFNETDPSSAQTECLKFVQDKVFAVLGGFEPSTTDTCTLSNHLPTFADIEVPEAEVKQYYPYYFSNAGELELIYHNFTHAVAQMGYLSAARHFKKVGVFYRDCIPGAYQALVTQFAQVGVTSSSIEGYDVGCPSAPFVPPSTVEAAILKFQQDGVTDVVPVQEYEDLQAFTRQANSQGYKPQYLVPDDGVVATSSSPTFEPDPTNFNGAVAITPYQYGAIQSGLPEDANTKRCDQVMTSHGLPTVYQSGDQVAGVECNLVWMLVAAMQHDPTLNPTGLAPGLAAAGSVAFSYPDGPNDFKASGGTFGGEYWRPLQFQAGCSCWKVTNPSFSSTFG